MFRGLLISDSDIHLLLEQKLIRTEDQQIYLNDGELEIIAGAETGIAEGKET